MPIFKNPNGLPRSRASVAIWIVKKRKTHQADKVDILLFMMVYEPT
jgi:hypothetical protein